MARSCRILFLVYDEFELLDVSGPASVFVAANRALGRDAYTHTLLSCTGGEVTDTSGITVRTQCAKRLRVSAADMLLVVGAEEEPLRAAVANRELVGWLRQTWPKLSRFGSICSGALLLAQAGALDGRRATTHWKARPALTNEYPRTKVDRDTLYVRDGAVWTSAGATSGIDMALAIVQHDHGSSIMRAVAKHLVVYAHRPGNQSQFSLLLDAQTSSGAPFSDLIAWIKNNLHQSLAVSGLAQRAAMSERTFHRKFTQAVGATPAKFVEALRLDHARFLLEAHQSVKQIAAATGFKSESGFRTAFEEKYGVSPSLYRAMHAAEQTAPNI